MVGVSKKMLGVGLRGMSEHVKCNIEIKELTNHDWWVLNEQIEKLEQENARLLFFNRELGKENAQLKELNRELLHILQWLIRLRDGYLKKGSTAPNSAGEYNEAMEQARELLAKAEGES